MTGPLRIVLEGDQEQAKRVVKLLEEAGHRNVLVVTKSGLRRAVSPNVALTAEVVLDVSRRVLSVTSGDEPLTRTEVHLLAYLIARASSAVATAVIAEAVFARKDAPAHNLVHRHLSNIRAKLCKVGAPDALSRTHAGYELRVTEHARDESES